MCCERGAFSRRDSSEDRRRRSNGRNGTRSGRVAERQSNRDRESSEGGRRGEKARRRKGERCSGGGRREKTARRRGKSAPRCFSAHEKSPASPRGERLREGRAARARGDEAR